MGWGGPALEKLSFDGLLIGIDLNYLSETLSVAMAKKQYVERPYKYRGRSYKRPPIPKLIDNRLEVWDYELDKQIGKTYDISKARNWKYWQSFLETEKSFRYERAGLSFTAIKERRTGSEKWPLRGRSEISVWYGHRRIDGKLRRKYLGYDEHLTADRLYMAAFDLAQNRLF